MDSNTQSKTNKFEQAPLYFFGFLGISCFTCCAIISLIIGISWLTTGLNFVYDQAWGIAIPIVLILWGLVPFGALIWYFMRRSR